MPNMHMSSAMVATEAAVSLVMKAFNGIICIFQRLGLPAGHATIPTEVRNIAI
jgi:hypothetical protein